MGVGISYYIYYQVRPEEMGSLRMKVERLIHAVSKTTGVRGRHLQSADDATIWMEIYEGVIDPLGFESCLATEVARLGVGAGLQPDSRRHIERFVACA